MRRLFFLPGAGARASFWHPAASLLPEEWQKNFFGWPGIGDEPPDPAVRGFDDLVDMVEARLEEPADLIAQSMGALVALRVALRVPSKVRRMVLTGTSGGLSVAEYGAVDWREDYRLEFPRAARWILEQGEDLSERLYSIAVPTLLLAGTRDSVSPAAVGERLAELIPCSRLHLIEGGDHDFAETHAAETAAEIERHLS